MLTVLTIMFAVSLVSGMNPVYGQGVSAGIADGQSTIVNGVETASVGYAAAGTGNSATSTGVVARALSPDATTINFDDLDEPCEFIETTALRDRYLSLGVQFSEPGSLDGGAILNECGGFGVTGHSPPNVLAFDNGAQLSDGGIPRGPETISFADPNAMQCD